MLINLLITLLEKKDPILGVSEKSEGINTSIGTV